MRSGKKLFCIFFLISFSASVFAQKTPQADGAADTLVLIQKTIAGQFPGYKLSKYETGELNNDNTKDAVVVLERKCDDESLCRKTVLLVNTSNKKYKVAAENDYLVECNECGGGGVGDPYQNIIIDNGTITYECLYGDCDKSQGTIIFKYNNTKKDWFLNKVYVIDYNCNEEDTMTGEIKTKEKYQDESDFGVVRFNDYMLDLYFKAE